MKRMTHQLGKREEIWAGILYCFEKTKLEVVAGYIGSPSVVPSV